MVCVVIRCVLDVLSARHHEVNRWRLRCTDHIDETLAAGESTLAVDERRDPLFCWSLGCHTTVNARLEERVLEDVQKGFHRLTGRVRTAIISRVSASNLFQGGNLVRYAMADSTDGQEF